jgi:hypothetical protein
MHVFSLFSIIVNLTVIVKLYKCNLFSYLVPL